MACKPPTTQNEHSPASIRERQEWPSAKPLIVEDAIQREVEGSKRVTDDEVMDYAAWRVLETLRSAFGPDEMTRERILRVIDVLVDEYRERYEAHRA